MNKMGRYDTGFQKQRVNNGTLAEHFVIDRLGGESLCNRIDNDYYDLETSAHLIEVKSCIVVLTSVVNRKKQYNFYQLGRFKIKLENHNGLKKCAEEAEKCPLYYFVINCKGQFVTVTCEWEFVNFIFEKYKFPKLLQVNWVEVFYPKLTRKKGDING